MLLIVCLGLFWKQDYLLSPTSIFLLYFAAVFPLSQLVAYSLDLPSYYFDSPRTIPSGKVAYAFFLVCLGLVSFCIARFSLPPIDIRWPRIEIIESRLFPFLAVCIAAALLGGVWVLHRAGGIAALYDDLGYFRSQGLRGLGAGIYAATTLVPTGMQFWLMHALKTKKRKYYRRVLIATLASFLLGGIFGFRGPIFVLLVQVVTIVYLMRRRPTRKQTVLAIVLMSVVLTVLGVARIALAYGSEAVAVMREAPKTALADAADSSVTRICGVQMLVIMTDYMRHEDYHFFIQNLAETAHVLLPSFILHKPISLSEKIGTAVYGQYLLDNGIFHDYFGGVSYTLIGEGYWNFGLLGIIIVCSGMGYLLRTVEWRSLSGFPSLLQIVMIKALAGSMVSYVEVPQLGINSICVDLFTNVGILVFLSLPVVGAAIHDGPAHHEGSSM